MSRDESNVDAAAAAGRRRQWGPPKMGQDPHSSPTPGMQEPEIVRYDDGRLATSDNQGKDAPRQHRPADADRADERPPSDEHSY